MATNFPGTGIDDNTTLPNPGSGSFTDNPSHAQLHDNANDAIKALETKVGINSSADTNSLDYKMATNASGLAIHIANTSNPHAVTKSQVGLSNVDNTSDVAKLLATLQAVYPIGAPYMSFSVSTNPATILGFGTWVSVGGYTLVGYKAADANFGTLGAVAAGEATHVLSTTEMPAHTHTTSGNGSFTSPGYAAFGENSFAGDRSVTSSSTGGGIAHNNIQPSFVVYMWQRTA